MRCLALLMLVCFAGCQSAPRRLPVAKAAVPVAKAEVLASQSRARVSKAKAKVESAQEAMGMLRKTATSEQWKALDVISVSLGETERLLREELGENLVLASSLKEAQDGLTQVLLEQERLTAAMEKAEQRARAYWRLKLWISALVAALAGWLAWRMVPAIAGPYRFWAAGGAATAAVGAVWLVL